MEAHHTFRVRVRKGITATCELHYGTSASCNCRTNGLVSAVGTLPSRRTSWVGRRSGSFGIPATTKNSKRERAYELRNRPQNCDADHKRGRDHPTANGVHGVVSVSHRENSMLYCSQAQFSKGLGDVVHSSHSHERSSSYVVGNRS
jgi:hypothetical protein